MAIREPGSGFTPLMEAAASGHEIIVQHLLDRVSCYLCHWKQQYHYTDITDVILKSFSYRRLKLMNSTLKERMPGFLPRCTATPRLSASLIHSLQGSNWVNFSAFIYYISVAIYISYNMLVLKKMVLYTLQTTVFLQINGWLYFFNFCFCIVFFKSGHFEDLSSSEDSDSAPPRSRPSRNRAKGVSIHDGPQAIAKFRVGGTSKQCGSVAFRCFVFLLVMCWQNSY